MRQGAERDEHGHIRIAGIDFGRIVKGAVTARLTERGLKVTIVSKDMGCELRCTDPIPYDVEYTRDLGYCAANYLSEGGSCAMIAVQAGKFKPIRFDETIDPATGRTRVRIVDTDTEHYKIAHRDVCVSAATIRRSGRNRTLRRRHQAQSRGVPEPVRIFGELRGSAPRLHLVSAARPRPGLSGAGHGSRTRDLKLGKPSLRT